MITLLSLLFLTAFASVLPATYDGVCDIAPGHRQDCGYVGTTKEQCEYKGCCWNPSQLQSPWCFHRDASRQCKGYSVSFLEQKKNIAGLIAHLDLINECSLYDRDVKRLLLDVSFETETRVHFKITDRDSARYEVAESQLPRPQVDDTWLNSADCADYRVEVEQEPFSIKVTRKSDGGVVFNTAIPQAGSQIKPLIYEERYLEVSTQLPINANIYGLGEVVHAYRRDPENTRQTLWARDAATPYDQNVYGNHPFYLEMRDGKAHGVFLLNSNGMDIFLRPGALTYKVIGGVLDFYVFTGPTPADVVHQYQQVIGNPHMIPYWVLGFHHCRFGYNNLQEVKEVVRRYRESQIPLETMWTDIDYMDQYKDFTFDPQRFPAKEVNSFVSKLHEQRQRYVLIVDPAIKAEQGYAPFDEGVKENVFIKYEDGNLFLGKVWPGTTAFPDYLSPNTQQWWTRQLKNMIEQVDVDGLWIDMNEPASFCYTNDPNGPCETPLFNGEDERSQLVLSDVAAEPSDSSPGYKIGNGGNNGPLNYRTVAPETFHYNHTKHYNVHNLYGHSEAIMTKNALAEIKPGKRTLILTRSSFAGTGKHAGHWTGDNFSSWGHLHMSIPAMLSFQLFGIPLAGADICGFIGDTTEELCARWMTLGAFYPFSRNHNTRGVRSQEPYLWDSVARASRKALSIRYTLLPFYYTLFYQAHKFGKSVVNPLFFEFPDDTKTYLYDRQFLVGPSLLISPVLEQGRSDVDAYFPAARWYDWYSHKVVYEGAEGKWLNLKAPLDFINVHIRGGFILPTQKPGLTTFESRLNGFELTVALDSNGYATGDLFLDDGESDPIDENRVSYIQLEARRVGLYGVLNATGYFQYQEQESKLSTIFVLGVNQAPQSVQLNDKDLDKNQWTWKDQEIVATNLEIDMCQEFELKWY